MRVIKSNLLGRDISALGFGSAAILGRVGRSDSLKALGVAYDAGINVFDTARAYGYGESEALLGEFLQGRRQDIVLSTKFGIVPARQAVWKRVARPILRSAIRVMPGIRKRIRGQVAAQFKASQFTVEVLNGSVATSLKKLRTDYLDVLFMHEADMAAIRDQELLRAMEGLVASGKVRAIGVSAELAVASEALKLPAVMCIQFACHIGNGFAKVLSDGLLSRSVMRFANHPFGGVEGALALDAKLAGSKLDQALPSSIKEKLEEGERHEVLADVVLNSALLANDIVLATMMKPAHIRTNAAAVGKSRFTATELELIRNWLTGVSVRVHEAG